MQPGFEASSESTAALSTISYRTASMACQSAPEQGWRQEVPASLRAAEEHGLSLGRAAVGRGPCRQSGQAVPRHGGLKTQGVCACTCAATHRSGSLRHGVRVWEGWKVRLGRWLGSESPEVRRIFSIFCPSSSFYGYRIHDPDRHSDVPELTQQVSG